MQASKKNIILSIVVLSLMLIIFIRVAYAKYTREITQRTFNVEFIAGDIKLELTDNANEFVIVPGQVISKETKVTVKAKSEACYLFIKLEKSTNFENYIEYEMASGWTELAENTDIYYMELSKTEVDTEYGVFNNNQIAVKDTVTKQDFEELNGNNLTINCTAYAVQKTAGITNATDAWNTINN